MGNNLIKLIQRKCRSESSNRKPVTVPPIENQNFKPSPIFIMNVHCFDELFEYLPLEDLLSLAQTCKSIQEMTGKFFKRNYSAARFVCSSDGIYRDNPDPRDKGYPIPCFIESITWIEIDNTFVYYKIKTIFRMHRICYDDLTIKFKYIKLHADELKSVKRVSLTKVRLDRKTVNCILKILENIEVLELVYPNINGDLNNVLLKYCKNLRRLKLIEVKLKNNNYKWLLQKYEKLKHLELIVSSFWHPSFKIDELGTFFELNPSVRSFSCDLLTLWSNKDSLLNSEAKLDTFELIFKHYQDYDENILRYLWDYLHQLYTRGIYKRLHINTDVGYRCDAMPEMPFLEKFSTWRYCSSLEPLSARLLGCTGISLIDGWRDKYWDYTNEIIVQNLLNMEHLYLEIRKCTHILLFIKRLRNLKKIKLICYEPGQILELDVLNTERGKLNGAHKVTIYVQDEVFLATKWVTKNGNTNFPLIEMKRIDSFEWNRPTNFCIMGTVHLPN